MKAASAHRSLRRGLLIWLFLFLVLAVTHRSFLFEEPWHEHSDFAVNALQIERAGQFREIHGNYSQFGFYHPGPAFYYVYALGERLLYDWLRCVPSPHNAHAVAGLALQCFFLTVALVIADGWIRRPLFIPLVLVALTIHLGLAENAFINTWPPRVLLMPFFCLTVSAASVAAGRVRHLPFVVLAGGFLVHGHVAQPLFVGVMAPAAYAFAWLRRRAPARAFGSFLREHRAAHLASGVCLVPFLVPLAIDLSMGPNSNLSRIVEFELHYHSASKPLWKSLLYFAGFFGYVKKPEAFLSTAGPERSAAIGEILPAYFVWAAIVAAGLFHLVRLRRGGGAGERPFVLSLAGFTVLAFLLSLYWGTAQIQRMFEYHGYFNYAILSSILLVPCAAISAWPVPRARLVAFALCIVAGALAWQRQRAPVHVDYSTQQIPAAVESALRLDPSPARTKYLVFPSYEWGEAVSIGLALQRGGYEFRADADWGPKFAADALFEPEPPDFDFSRVSIWRLSQTDETNTGIPVRGGLRIYFEPRRFDPATAVIDCRKGGNLERYTAFGITFPDDTGAWTMSRFAGLMFHAPATPVDLLIAITAGPFSVSGETVEQPMTLRINGTEILSHTLRSPDTVTARVPASVWNSRRPVTIVFHLPNAVMPRLKRLSLDERQLGWHLERIAFQPAP